VLLGVDGVCVISHGSSNALAILSSVRCAVDCVENQVVLHIAEAVARAR
jgi:glycerol-3-phosphate acyltransferase PlsX